MVRLKNIKICDGIIESDYYPESENTEFGHVSLNIATGEEKYSILDEYGKNYAVKAIYGLERIIEKLNVNEISELPKERTVMWY